MANIYATEKETILYLTVKDIFKLRVTQVTGGGVNYYACYDLIYGNYLPITKRLALEVLDAIKEGKICDVTHSFMKDEILNFPDEMRGNI